MAYQIFEIIFPVLFIASIGFIYAKRQNISMEMPNKINLELFIPIMVFYNLSEKMPPLLEIGIFSLGGVIVVFGSSIVAYPFVRLLKLNARTFLPPIMFNNSINLGLPLALFAFGEDAMSLAISLAIVQIIGQFTIGSICYSGSFSLRNLLTNPVIIATILGVSFNLFSFHLPSFVLMSLKMMSAVVIPLILVSLGVRLSNFELKFWKISLLGAILTPLSGVIMALVAIEIFGYSGIYASLLILFGALPPAVLNAIMAEQHGKDAVLVASVVALGNLFAIIAIPLVLIFIH